MSFQNLNWHSRVEAASRLPLIPPAETFFTATGANRRRKSESSGRRKRRQHKVLHPGRGRRDFFGAGKPEPRFLWAKAARTAAVVVFLFRLCHDEDEPKFPQVSASAKR